MASVKIDQVGLAITGLIEGQFSNWQSLVKDGRKITGVNIVVDVDSLGQRSYDVQVDYAVQPVTSGTGATGTTSTITAPASDGAKQ